MSAPFGAGPLRIISADERLREARGIKGVLTGTSGIGKTTQLLTLDPQRTLFLNLEAGELAVAQEGGARHLSTSLYVRWTSDGLPA